MWNKQSYKVKEYRTKKLGRNLIQKRDDEDCQCVFESPQFKHDVPCLWAVVSLPKENGELKIVPVPGVLCFLLISREKEFVFKLFILQVHD